MSSSKALSRKKELKEKEELLRSKLNKTSEDVEKNALKILGLAALGGVASYVLYRVISGSEGSIANQSKKKQQKKNKQVKSSETVKHLAKSSGWQSKAVESLIKAGIPLFINFIDDFLQKRSDKRENDKEKS